MAEQARSTSRTDTALRHADSASTQHSETVDQGEKALRETATVLTARTGTLYHEHMDQPPPLNYTVKIHSRERTILIWFTLLFVEAGILPLILFYALRWGAHLSITINLAIITSLIGSVSGYKFAQRMWFLWLGKDHETRRPIGAGRWGVDFFQIQISIAMGAFFIPLIIGSSVSPANPRIVALALPCVMITLTFPMLVTGLLPHRIRFPARISSFPPYEPLPPLAYTFVEDVVAVDGGGCTEFRQAWRTRYEESIVIRRLIRYMSLVWGFSGVFGGGALIAAAWTASVDTAYGVCYGLPWLWALLTAAGCVVWTHRELERERREWVAPTVHKEHMLPIREGKYDVPRPSTVEAGLQRAATYAPRRSEGVHRTERENHPPPTRAATFA